MLYANLKETEGENMPQEIARVTMEELFGIIGRLYVESEALRSHAQNLQVQLQQRERLLQQAGARAAEETGAPTGPE